MEPSVSIDVELDSAINYAMQQNGVPIVKLLRVTNLTDEQLDDLTVTIVAQPEFFVPNVIMLSPLAPSGSVNLGTIDLRPSHDFLANLTEKVAGSIAISVKSKDELLASHEHRIDILAYDEWPGLNSPPELMAAFVTPNSAAVERVLRDASQILKEWSGSSSLNGYMSRDPEKAYQIIGSIYEAIRRYKIAYITAPASYEPAGQKIRMPDRLLEVGLGTCLDLTILMAACAEQAGLNPIILVHRNHAYCGVWLEDDSFSDSVMYDAATLRKRVDLHEMCVFETTLLTSNDAVTFQQAVDTGRRLLNDTEEFRFAVDVHRARVEQVRPLPLRLQSGVGVLIDGTEAKENESNIPTLAPISIAGRTVEEEGRSRLDRWKKQLLDLSLRNRLLNFKPSRTSVRILYTDLAELQSILSESKGLRVLSVYNETADPNDGDLPIRVEGNEKYVVGAVLRDDIRNGRLRTDLAPPELSKNLTQIFRKARNSIEEGGVNTLFLALGFLKWYEKGTSRTSHLAPIILLPLTITRISVREGYFIGMGDDDPLLNVTLLELLEKDFGISVPNLDDAISGENGMDVDGILNAFRAAVKHIPRWEVEEEAHVGHFSFSKFLMWMDLETRSMDLSRNSVVDHLINTPNEPFVDQGDFPDPAALDDAYSLKDTFCPVSADSSQLAAVYASGEGKTFVLHGPPGTGKSQTITNIIAHNLALGKTVLFVSEKKAALDVVHKRLKKSGLEPFCLELHSNKSSKAEFVDQLRRSLAIDEMSNPQKWAAEADRLHRLRTELNAYVSSLHQVRGSGDTVFRAVSELIRLHEMKRIDLGLLSLGPMDRERKEALFVMADRLQTAAGGIVHPIDNVWASTDYSEWSSSLAEGIVNELDRGARANERLYVATSAVSAHLGLPSGGWSRDVHEAAIRACVDLRTYLPEVPTSAMLKRMGPEMGSKLRSWATLGRERDAARRKVLSVFHPSVLSIDLTEVRADMKNAYATWLTSETMSRLPNSQDWVGAVESSVIVPLDELKLGAVDAEQRLASVFSSLGIDLGMIRLGHLAIYGEMAGLLSNVPSLPIAGMLSAEDWDASRIAASDVVRHGRERDRLRSALSERYADALLELDIKSIRQELGVARTKWFLPKALGYGKAKRLIQRVSRGEVPKIDALLADLDAALSLRAEMESLERNAPRVRTWLGPYWRDGNVDWSALETAISHCDLLWSAIFRMCRAANKDPAQVRQHIARVLSDERDRFAPDGDLGSVLNAAALSAKNAVEKLARARNVLDERRTAQWNDETIADVNGRIDEWRAQFQRLLDLRNISLEGVPAHPELFNYLDAAILFNRLNAEMGTIAEEASLLLGREWNDGEVDWDRVERSAEGCTLLHENAHRLASDEGAYRATVEHWASFVDGSLVYHATLQTALDGYVSAYDDLGLGLQDIERTIRKDPSQAWGRPEENGFVENVAMAIAKLQDAVPGLKAWCHWRAVRIESIPMGLIRLAEAFESSDIEANDIVEVFRKSLYHEWAEKEISSDVVLNRFFSPEFEKKIRDFRSLDGRFQELTVAETRARLASRLPSTTGNENGNSELGILKREMEKQRRLMPVRALIKKIPNLLPRLKPCWLMSPISVTQYIDASYPPFDLVVFDEASQMPVWDAVGAIARGTSLVVVGDPKQLPPTNFFNRTDSDELAEADEDVVEDMESILDECIAAQLPEQHLRWHYRSRHESLIAFSNKQYYDNGLITFPSPQSVTAVKFRAAQGVYDAGASRTNRKEADAVVKEIVRRLKDPELSRYSIGVVTFSISQQALIEDLLDEAKDKDPELEALSERVEEPIFIKNLESVQGDERDVILFSVCYGPDRAGKISMNFGPLNKTGGERRLNVAITRARWEVMVFSSLTADKINLSRTRAAGVRDLKYFLDYAERGTAALSEVAAVDPDAGTESYFEEEVSKALRSVGHEVHHQIGCSGYRIDMAIVDPEKPGSYLLGIECDGANYHRSRTARDRDELRQSVLEGLGWKLHRIWSTDWWHSPKQELEKIEKAIERTKRERSSLTIVQVEVPAKIELPHEEVEEEAFPIIDRGALATLEAYEVYRQTYMHDDSGDSFEYWMMKGELERLVEVEGPVLLHVAAKRLAPYWNVNKCTERFVDRVRHALSQTSVLTTDGDVSEVLWPRGSTPESYGGFRTPGDDPDSKRKIGEIPLVEVINATAFVLKGQVSMPAEDLMKETVKLFGFQRTGATIQARISEAIQRLVEDGRIRYESGRLVYMEL